MDLKRKDTRINASSLFADRGSIDLPEEQYKFFGLTTAVNGKEEKINHQNSCRKYYAVLMDPRMFFGVTEVRMRGRCVGDSNPGQKYILKYGMGDWWIPISVK